MLVREAVFEQHRQFPHVHHSCGDLMLEADFREDAPWLGEWSRSAKREHQASYEWLVENYNDGDEIFIFGFSRGAYTARSLAGLITKFGILKPGSPIGVTQLSERYKRAEMSGRLCVPLVGGPHAVSGALSNASKGC